MKNGATEAEAEAILDAQARGGAGALVRGGGWDGCPAVPTRGASGVVIEGTSQNGPWGP